MIALFLRSFKCGRRGLMELAHLAPKLDPRLAPIVADWGRMKPSLQNAADLDALCEAHGVEPAHFIGVVGEAAARFRNNFSILIAALNMPAIVAASVKRALTLDGARDREMLFQHAGFLPAPRGKQLRMLNHAALKAEVNGGCGEPLPRFESRVTEIEESLKNDE